MASSELMSALTGRQFVAAAKQDLVFADDIGAAADVLLGTLPEGSVITGGWTQVLVAGAIGALVVELRDPVTNAVVTTLTTSAAGTPAKVDVVPDGIPTAAAYNIYITSAVDQSADAGTGYNYLEYVVTGRSQFSEG